MNPLRIAFLFLFAWLISSCSKCKDIACFSPPASFRCKVLNTKNENISSKTPYSLRYTSKGVAKTIDLRLVTPNTGEAFLSTDEIGWLSAGNEKITNYILLSGESQIGTLTYVNQHLDDDCCSFYKTSQILFNSTSVLENLDADYCYLLIIKP